MGRRRRRRRRRRKRRRRRRVVIDRFKSGKEVPSIRRDEE
jgi:hypothetical protein